VTQVDIIIIYLLLNAKKYKMTFVSACITKWKALFNVVC